MADVAGAAVGQVEAQFAEAQPHVAEAHHEPHGAEAQDAELRDGSKSELGHLLVVLRKRKLN